MSQRSLPFPPLPANPKSLGAKQKPNAAGRPRRLDSDTAIVGSAEWEKLLAEMDELSLVELGDLELTSQISTGRSKSKSEAVKLVENHCLRSGIIKASIDKNLEYRIDRARSTGMQLTRPAFVRHSVEDLIAHLETADWVKAVEPRNGISGESGRKLYLKVAFSPAVIAKIGHHKPEPHGLCKLLGCTRQQVIDFALRRILER